MSSVRVDIGFAEKCDSNLLSSAHFPSKIGGKPAWLSLSNLPTQKVLQCRSCKGQLVFLCQIYSPYEDDDSNFHRTLFIFICRSSQCSIRNDNNNIIVLRSSLPRSNEFYNFEPPTDWVTFDYKKFEVNICCCGCLATNACSACKKVYYCCKEHQVSDWTNHKKYCGKDTISAVEFCWRLLYPEFEIVIEHEANLEPEDQLKQIEQLSISGTMQDVDEAELQAACIAEDKQFSKFQKRIVSDKQQVVRFERGGEPLYIAQEPKVQVVPKCQYCGGGRQFEFQIMPQMLCVINENDVDFGIIAVYTCKKSCTEDGGYKIEYAFKQDVTE